MIFIALLLGSLATARPPAPKTISPPRVYVPDDADPCDFERFKADAFLGQWIRQTSPNTARAAKCYHGPAKILPALSALMGELDHGALRLDGGAKIDLRAAALTGYQVDSMIEVRGDDKRSVALIIRSGVNGPTAAQVYVGR